MTRDGRSGVLRSWEDGDQNSDYLDFYSKWYNPERRKQLQSTSSPQIWGGPDVLFGRLHFDVITLWRLVSLSLSLSQAHVLFHHPLHFTRGIESESKLSSYPPQKEHHQVKWERERKKKKRQVNGPLFVWFYFSGWIDTQDWPTNLGFTIANNRSQDICFHLFGPQLHWLVLEKKLPDPEETRRRRREREKEKEKTKGQDDARKNDAAVARRGWVHTDRRRGRFEIPIACWRWAGGERSSSHSHEDDLFHSGMPWEWVWKCNFLFHSRRCGLCLKSV